MAVIFLASPESLPHGFSHAEARYDSILDEISSVDSNEDILLVVRDTQAAHIARGVRLALNSRRIAIYATDAPATQFFMQAAVLNLLQPEHLGLSRQVEQQVRANSYCQVLVSSVAKISQPNPKLLDHALSIAPWTRFLVDWTNQKISQTKQLRAVQAPLLIAAKSETQWKAEKIEPLPNDAVLLPTQPRSPWEAKRWVELSAFFAYPEVLAKTIGTEFGGESGARCVSCSRFGSAGRCLFCELPLTNETRLAASHPQSELAGGSL